MEDRNYKYSHRKGWLKHWEGDPWIAKAKLLVCCYQEVPCLNIDSAIIANKQNNFEQKYKLYWSAHAAKSQHGVGIAIKVDKGIKIEETISVSARIIVANILLYRCPYEL